MRPFTSVRSIITPLDKINVDTDQIVPKQFLKLVQRSGFGRYLFYDWRYKDGGGDAPDDCNSRGSGTVAGDGKAVRSDFVLNDPRYDGSSILVTGENFGCGSSREHAVWALVDYGFRAVIAPSFADIFYSNCFKNGMLPVRLDPDAIILVRNFDGEAEVNLEDMEVRLYRHGGTGEPSSHSTPVHTIGFEIEPDRRTVLLEGLDEIAQTLKHEHEISRFEAEMGRKGGVAPPLAFA